MNLGRLILATGLTIAAAGSGAVGGSDAAAPLRLSLPIACTIGENCFVQQYFDHDPGPGARDFHCGNRVYDGHDGTDFRVPSLADLQRGVNVLAAADGMVIAARNDMADNDIESGSRPDIAGRECGNGVVIAHADGWETQYCHMRRGSVSVAVGDRVRRGVTIGMVGLSGDTEFPHLHLSVRHQRTKIDPFAPQATPGGRCGASVHTLWTGGTQASLGYRETEFINAGFSAGPLTMADIEAHRWQAPRSDSPALVFFARAIGGQAGDRFTVEIRSPSGSVLATSGDRITSPKAQLFRFVGKKTPAHGWQGGTYQARAMIVRDGRTIAFVDRSLRL